MKNSLSFFVFIIASISCQHTEQKAIEKDVAEQQIKAPDNVTREVSQEQIIAIGKKYGFEPSQDHVGVEMHKKFKSIEEVDDFFKFLYQEQKRMEKQNMAADTFEQKMRNATSRQEKKEIYKKYKTNYPDLFASPPDSLSEEFIDSF